MDSHPVPRRALYWALAVLAGPFVGVLLVLVLAGEVALGAAAVAAIVATAALWAPVRRHLSGLARVADRLNRLDAGGVPERLHLESPLVSRRLASAFADSTAALHQRLGDLAASSASAEYWALAVLAGPFVGVLLVLVLAGESCSTTCPTR